MDPTGPLRVLHVVPSYWPATAYGGPVESIHALCLALARAGARVRVITTDADGAGRLDVPIDRDVEVAPGLRIRYHRRLGGGSVAPGLLRVLPGEIAGCDVVHLTAVYSFPTIPTLLVSRLRDRPLVWSPRGSLQRWEGASRPRLKAAWRAACAVLLPRRAVLHVTSQEEAAASVRAFPGLPAAVVPNGVDVPEALERGPREGPLHLVFLGRLHPIKGIENLIDACALCARNGWVGWRLSVAGEGDRAYTASLRARAEGASLGEQVSFLGAVRGVGKTELLRSADLVVVPSHSENFSMVVAEALAHGVPVVAGTGTPWQRLVDRGCGFWVSNEPGSLAATLQAAASKDLRAMGASGRRWMAEEYRWDALAARMLETYRGLLEAYRG